MDVSVVPKNGHDTAHGARVPAIASSSPHLWLQMRDLAHSQSVAEPLLAAYLHTFVLQHSGIEGALAYLLGHKLFTPELNAGLLSNLFQQCIQDAPAIAVSMQQDLQAAMERDPAAKGCLNVFMNQKGFQALQAYRISHHLWCTQRHALALFLQGRVAEVYAIDIHPAARIGHGVFVDHGTGVVIGETAVVGNDCTIFQDVTLGGTGKDTGDRHPKIDRGVLICAGAKVLGNVRIGANAKIGAASVVLIDVPAGATAVGVPATVVEPRHRALHERLEIA